MINGINLEGLKAYTQLIKEEADEAISQYGITAQWLGGVKSRIQTNNQILGSTTIVKNFSFGIDEPVELLGDNENPTPQDYLFAGLAGCMMVGFVVGASKKGLKLESVDLHIAGDLNLRGFLNIDPMAAVGFEKINFNYDVKGEGTQADYDEIIQHVQQFSPNYRTIADRVTLKAEKNN